MNIKEQKRKTVYILIVFQNKRGYNIDKFQNLEYAAHEKGV